jgi:hypothetical protein
MPARGRAAGMRTGGGWLFTDLDLRGLQGLNLGARQKKPVGTGRMGLASRLGPGPGQSVVGSGR